jgi:hypothetical protein
MITNAASGTNLHEIATGIYRINTPLALPDGSAFSFNQYLVTDDEPLVFHTGARGLFPLVSEAIARVLPLASIRYVAFAHFEADECGALNEFLAAAPRAVPVASQVGAMVSVNAFADRPARAMADGEVLRTGRRAFKWLDAPHVPHAPPSPRATSSARARPSASRWTTTPTRRTPPRRWRSSRARRRKRSRACTAARGAGMGRR